MKDKSACSASRVVDSKMGESVLTRVTNTSKSACSASRVVDRVVHNVGERGGPS